MNISELLGEAYKEGMTVEEINAALADKNFVDPATQPESVPKTMFDAKTAELSKLKKDLSALKNQSLTDEQKLQEALKKAKNAELNFNKKSVRLDVEKTFVSAGLEQKDYEGFIDGIVTEDKGTSITLANSLIAMVTKQKAAAENKVRKEFRGKLPDLPSGGDGSVTKEDFNKMSLTEKMRYKSENPEQYNQFFGGN